MSIQRHSWTNFRPLISGLIFAKKQYRLHFGGEKRLILAAYMYLTTLTIHDMIFYSLAGAPSLTSGSRRRSRSFRGAVGWRLGRQSRAAAGTLYRAAARIPLHFWRLKRCFFA